MPLSSDSPTEERLQNGNNLLHTCTNQAEAERLVKDGVNVNGINFSGQIPIHSLMRLGNPETKPVIFYLLSLMSVNVNAAEPDGTTIAHLCEWGPIMSALVSREEFNPNKIRPSDGNTPLMLAVTKPKHPDITEKLLADSRIDFDIINPKNGKTALQLAEEKGGPNLELIRNKIAERRQAAAAAQSPGRPLVSGFTSSISEATTLAAATAPNLVDQSQQRNDGPGSGPQ